MSGSFFLIHSFFKPEHPVVFFVFKPVFFACLRIVRVGMVTVEELHDMESAAVDVEMDIPFFKIGSDGFPYLHLRVELLDRAPRGVSPCLSLILAVLWP